MNGEKSGLLKLSALWKKKAKNGDTYLVGSLADAKMLVLKNNRKGKESQPDFFVYLTEPTPNPKPLEPGPTPFDDEGQGDDLPYSEPDADENQ